MGVLKKLNVLFCLFVVVDVEVEWAGTAEVQILRKPTENERASKLHRVSMKKRKEFCLTSHKERIMIYSKRLIGLITKCVKLANFVTAIYVRACIFCLIPNASAFLFDKCVLFEAFQLFLSFD